MCAHCAEQVSNVAETFVPPEEDIAFIDARNLAVEEAAEAEVRTRTTRRRYVNCTLAFRWFRTCFAVREQYRLDSRHLDALGSLLEGVGHFLLLLNGTRHADMQVSMIAVAARRRVHNLCRG